MMMHQLITTTGTRRPHTAILKLPWRARLDGTLLDTHEQSPPTAAGAGPVEEKFALKVDG